MTSFSFKNKLKIPSDLLVQELADGESVFLNLNNESYMGLDDVGTRIWKALTNSNSIEEAYSKLKEEYDVDPKVLRDDISDLVKKLLENGLVQISNK